MKKILLSIATVPLFALSLTCCSKSTDGNSSAQDSIAMADSLVSELEVDLKALSSAKSYALKFDSIEMKLAISSKIEWPEKISKYNITPLQDSILGFCFPEFQAFPIKVAMLKYVEDLEMTGITDDATSITPIDKIYPDSVSNFSMNLDARMMEITDKLVTYQITETSYLGGAHPNMVSRTFTYDLTNAKILNISDIIAQHKIDAFKTLVARQLADQLELTPAALDEMLLVKPLPLGKTIYCTDGNIYIHYNPYEILPHIFGATDVQISALENENMLTPYARQLLVE